MAKKAMFTNKEGSAASDFAGRIHALANEMGSDYESHAANLHRVANSLRGETEGKAGVKEHKSNRGGSGQKKTGVALGG